MAKNSPNILLGYTTRQHLLLDLDNTVLRKVVLLVLMLQLYYKKLGDCLIVLSSTGSDKQHIKYSRLGRALVIRALNNYHVVFDAQIGYNSCCKIISTLAGLHVLERDYLKIRRFRGDMTLRITPNIDRHEITPFPKPLYIIHSKHLYKRGGYIWEYLYQLYNAHSLFKGSKFHFGELKLFRQSLRLSNLLHPLLPKSKPRSNLSILQTTLESLDISKQ